jgi:hypothetical protein
MWFYCNYECVHSGFWACKANIYAISLLKEKWLRSLVPLSKHTWSSASHWYSGNMRWVWHVARMAEMRTVYKIMVVKSEGKKQLVRTRHRRVGIKLILVKQGWSVWIGFIWLRIGTSVEFMAMKMNLRFFVKWNNNFLSCSVCTWNMFFSFDGTK